MQGISADNLAGLVRVDVRSRVICPVGSTPESKSTSRKSLAMTERWVPELLREDVGIHGLGRARVKQIHAWGQGQVMKIELVDFRSESFGMS